MAGRGSCTGWFFAAAAALYLASPLLASRLDPNGYAGGRTRSLRERELRNTSSIAVMLGEFRTAMSDIMYIKSERYLDHGIAYMPHLKKTLSISGQDAPIEGHDEEGHGADQQAPGFPEEHVHGPECEHGHDEHRAEAEHEHEHGDGAGTPTVIPTPEQDFRGFIGHLERSVKPWRDPKEAHQHSDGTELLPWFRLMTLSDDHYVLGYTVGGWWLKSRNLDEAIRFAGEGVTNNPNSFQVWYTLAQLHLEKGRRAAGAQYLTAPTPEALADLNEARRLYRRSAELALRERPANAKDLLDDPRWGNHNEDDAMAALRMAALSEWHFGDKQEAVSMARSYLARVGDDILLHRLATLDTPPAP